MSPSARGERAWVAHVLIDGGNQFASLSVHQGAAGPAAYLGVSKSGCKRGGEERVLIARAAPCLPSPWRRPRMGTMMVIGAGVGAGGSTRS